MYLHVNIRIYLNFIIYILQLKNINTFHHFLVTLAGNSNSPRTPDQQVTVSLSLSLSLAFFPAIFSRQNGSNTIFRRGKISALISSHFSKRKWEIILSDVLLNSLSFFFCGIKKKKKKKFFGNMRCVFSWTVAIDARGFCKFSIQSNQLLTKELSTRDHCLDRKWITISIYCLQVVM